VQRTSGVPMPAPRGSPQGPNQWFCGAPVVRPRIPVYVVPFTLCASTCGQCSNTLLHMWNGMMQQWLSRKRSHKQCASMQQSFQSRSTVNAQAHFCYLFGVRHGPHLLLEQAVVGDDGGGEVLAHALDGPQHRRQRGVVVLCDDLQQTREVGMTECCISIGPKVVMCTASSVASLCSVIICSVTARHCPSLRPIASTTCCEPRSTAHGKLQLSAVMRRSKVFSRVPQCNRDGSMQSMAPRPGKRGDLG
jgi:hypothetical protein